MQIFEKAIMAALLSQHLVAAGGMYIPKMRRLHPRYTLNNLFRAPNAPSI
jgi:hypothetical protein